MKIKVDFVTNSSSSSFVVMGNCIEISNIPEGILQKIQEKEEIDMEDLQYNLDVFTEGTDLQFSTGYEFDGVISVGIPYTRMKDNEMLGGFKERVKQQVLDSFGIEIDPGHIEDCWMDN